MVANRLLSYLPERPALFAGVAGLALLAASCASPAQENSNEQDALRSPSGCVGIMPASWKPVESQEDITALARTLDASTEEAQDGIIGTAECAPGIRYDELITGYAFRVHGVSERCVAFGPATPDKQPRVNKRYEEVKAFCLV